MVVDEFRHDGDGDSTWTLVKDLSNVFVLDTNHVLTVDLTEVVVDEETITRERGREVGRERVRERGREEGWSKSGKEGGREREGGG